VVLIIFFFIFLPATYQAWANLFSVEVKKFLMNFYYSPLFPCGMCNRWGRKRCKRWGQAALNVSLVGVPLFVVRYGLLTAGDNFRRTAAATAEAATAAAATTPKWTLHCGW